MRTWSRSDFWRRTAPGGACLLLLGCALAESARGGGARLLSTYALASGSLAPAELAAALNPSDPRALSTRAAVLSESDRYAEAAAELESALRLSPRDYFLWLSLGRERDLLGDARGARDAYEMSARLAPFYAPPRWELGNLLLRAGERQGAFSQLRRAAESNAALMPAVIDLAWDACSGDADEIRRVVNPQTAQARIELARYLAGHGELKPALELLSEAGGGAADAERLALLQERLDAQRFDEAYQVWLNRPSARAAVGADESSAVNDGGFEAELFEDNEPGFGWRLGEGAERVVNAALDPNAPREGARSLRLEWGGDAHPALPIISQLCVVEPGRRYRLSFAVRTEDLTSGGGVFVAVADAADKNGTPLGESPLLRRDSRGWRDYSVDLTTRATTRAVVVLVRRQCATEPCPVYGRTWLDAFALRKL